MQNRRKQEERVRQRLKEERLQQERERHQHILQVSFVLHDCSLLNVKMPRLSSVGNQTHHLRVRGLSYNWFMRVVWAMLPNLRRTKTTSTDAIG